MSTEKNKSYRHSLFKNANVACLLRLL